MDVRETILARLTAIAETTGATVKRMAVTLNASERPAIVINDGDETISAQKGGLAPLVVTLRPELILLAQASDNPATALNKLRTTVIKAVLSDTTLATLAGVNGTVRYAGCQTDVARGEAYEASMSVAFEVNYTLKPADL